MDETAARAAASEAGVTLVPCSGCASGWKGVTQTSQGWRAAGRKRTSKNHTKVWHLGTFNTAEEAALAYAKAMRSGPCECVQCRATTAGPSATEPPTEEETLALASTEGLKLATSVNETGYKYVMRTNGKFIIAPKAREELECRTRICGPAELRSRLTPRPPCA